MNKKSAIKAIEKIENLLEKCGGPGSGRPGPCPTGGGSAGGSGGGGVNWKEYGNPSEKTKAVKEKIDKVLQGVPSLKGRKWIFDHSGGGIASTSGGGPVDKKKMTAEFDTLLGKPRKVQGTDRYYGEEGSGLLVQNDSSDKSFVQISEF